MRVCACVHMCWGDVGVCVCVCVGGGGGLEGYRGETWRGVVWRCVCVCACMCAYVCVCGGGGSVCWRGMRVRDGGGLC